MDLSWVECIEGGVLCIQRCIEGGAIICITYIEGGVIICSACHRRGHNMYSGKLFKLVTFYHNITIATPHYSVHLLFRET